MHRNTQRWQRWRWLTACLLICVLFLQSIAVAMPGAVSDVRLSADGYGVADLGGFELCRHEKAATEQPGDPGNSAGDRHCMFCIAGPGFVLEPPIVSWLFHPVENSTAPWPLTAWRFAPVTVDANARPRGPPTVA